MTAAEKLEKTIRAAIPLSEAMQFRIEELELDRIEVSAPLEPNINIHGTGFAGSIYSVAVLSGWALCTHILKQMDIDADLVVASAEISYRAPINTALRCRCRASDQQRDAFVTGAGTRGKGKMVLEIAVGNSPEASLKATYIALAGQSD